jgi:hypothetical protein
MRYVPQVKNSKHNMNLNHQRTSIGQSVNTNPKNKHKRKNWKPYRGQGKAR